MQLAVAWVRLISTNIYFLNIVWVKLIMIPVACSKDIRDKNWERDVNETVKNWVGKKMILPDSVKSVIVESEIIPSPNKKSKKLVTYIDGNCGTCIANLAFWQNFSKDVLLNGGGKYEFYVFVYSEDKEQFREIISESGYNLPMLFDVNNSFVLNFFLYDKRFHTALLNDKNEVIMIGDPTLNPKLGDLYKEVILQSNDEK